MMAWGSNMYKYQRKVQKGDRIVIVNRTGQKYRSYQTDELYAGQVLTVCTGEPVPYVTYGYRRRNDHPYFFTAEDANGNRFGVSYKDWKKVS